MKVSFHTLGCKTNAYETQAIREQMEEAGWEIGEFSDPCDVYVINTCAVTREAARKSRQMTGRCKRQNPDALVVVTGCYAQEAGEELLSETGADLVVGNGEKTRILPMILSCFPGPDASSDHLCLRDLSRCREYESQSITRQAGHVRVYVKIQDGCDRFCSYCIIPYLRGRSRSRDPEAILQEVTRLAENGCREIVLTGIDISSYSFSEKEISLGRLISRIGQVPGIERIRLGSLEVGIVTREFLDTVQKVQSFCPQFHLSLQSGCDSVLKRMNRHYTTQQYKEAVDLIREYYPDAGITTDIITGFPGETEEEFETTVRFAQEIRFSRIHVFPYSRRPGTRADRLADQLSHAVKDERARRLIAAAQKLQQEYEQTWIGKPCEILVEEAFCVASEIAQYEKEAVFLAGYTPEYVRITAETDMDLRKAQEFIGRIVCVLPEQFRDGNLHGSYHADACIS